MNQKQLRKQVVPLFASPVKASFPSPAEDFIEAHLNLNDYIIKHPAATFFVRVEGTSMIRAGINSGDILVVDRSIEPKNGHIVIAVVNGEFTVKRIHKTETALYLMPENKRFNPILITEDMDFQVWGVVSYVIHKA